MRVDTLNEHMTFLCHSKVIYDMWLQSIKSYPNVNDGKKTTKFANVNARITNNPKFGFNLKTK